MPAAPLPTHLLRICAGALKRRAQCAVSKLANGQRHTVALPRKHLLAPEEEAKMRKTPSVCFADTSLLYRAPAKILQSKRFVGRGAASIGAKPRVKQAACEICSAATRRQGNKELQILGGDGVGDAEAVGGGRGDAARVPAALAAGIHARNALRLEIFAAQDADGRARARFDAR